MHARKKALLRKFLRAEGRSTASYINTVWLNSNKNSSGDEIYSERELLYDDNIHVEACAYAH